MIDTAHAIAPAPLATLRRTAKRLPQPLRGQVEAIARTIDELREILLHGTDGQDGNKLRG